MAVKYLEKAIVEATMASDYKKVTTVRGEYDKYKTKAVSFSAERGITWDRVQEIRGNKAYQGHRFVVEGTIFDGEAPPSRIAGNTGRLMIWLAQAGQIVSIGLPSFEYAVNDVESFKRAFAKIAAITDEDIINTLYNNGYDHYGRG